MGLADSLSEIKGLFNGSGPTTNNTKYQEALGHLLKYDVGRSAYFDIQILNAPTFNPNTGDSPSTLSYLCHSAELPGESTATVNQKIYGVTEKFSVMTGYNDLTLAFYTRGSGDEYVRKYFQRWMAFITGRAETIKYQGQVKSETNYNVQYKSDYVGTIKITHYSITGEPLVEVKLFDAFPLSINQIPLAWASQNQAQSLNVSFAYTEYEYNFLHVKNTGDYSPSPLAELMGTAIQTAATINTIKGAFKSGNPLAATSVLSNFNVSSPAPYTRG